MKNDFPLPDGPSTNLLRLVVMPRFMGKSLMSRCRGLPVSLSTILMPNRRQAERRDQARLGYPEARTDGAARAEPNLFELCRVVTEEGKSKEEGEAKGESELR